MVHFRDRIAPVTWELLLSTLYSLRVGPPVIDEKDTQILLVSPWISDIENRQHRLTLPIREIVASEMGRDFRNLAFLLIALSDAGANVGLMTCHLDSNWKREWSEPMKQREKLLLNMLDNSGITVRMHDENHAKFVSTPLGILSGSANITDNGYYNNRELMNLTLRREDGFSQSRQVCSDLWYEGYPYIA